MTQLDSLDTPLVAIDLEVLERNLKRTADMARQAGIKLRPHTKTHKSVWLAKEQIRHGAVGITVAKLGEAEVMAAGGIRDILVAYPIVGEVKLRRLGKLMEQAEMTVSTDDLNVARGLSDLGVSLGRPVSLYVDVNSGLNRCGREPGAETLELVLRMAELPGIRIKGIMTHAGHAYGKTDPDSLREAARHEAECLVSTKRLLEERGVPIAELSVGSTPTSKYADAIAGTGITEMRPGAYVFGDMVQRSIDIIGDSELAMTVRATVVSKPRPGTIIVDAGSKTLTSDLNAQHKGYGLVKGVQGAVIERLSEEHGIVTVPDETRFQIGEVIEIVPNHCCVVTNLHDRLAGVREGRLERWIEVDARGKVQ